ncbi:lysylphosphatidylglycerol synthase transmembrane domain-containing protein [Umezawaea sp. Da 62-37]|uniref:lysylphosphatidylglycerol synthase transmembrane domain-containing protein n=1 Tax=Umezawaea sp. Da 62-37 TaxID=3075927 RepID=UPI0028F7438F|nr:lysylphosphatidylglycerol synthase transmembrane domain-containing protein [Umezawaea sp. Da 62-37]WNV82641.1 lysylphosphatidylglycerol synthase transmembrane domain-containing protein [Umezawaea sp. Da 62-37]
MGRLWPWLRLLLAVGILVALGWRLGTGAFVDGLRAISAWSVLAALGIGLATTVLCAWRWCVVARGLGLPLTLGTAVADYYRGLLLNSVLPAGVLGDVHRAVNHGKQSGDVGRGVRAVVFERFAGQAVLIAIGVAVLLTRPAAAVDLVPGRGVVLTALAVLAVAAVLAAGSPAVRRALLTTWADARTGLLSRYALPRVLFSSAATVVGHLALFLVAARVAGSTASTGQLVPLFVLALLVMAVPVNVGGWGPREAFLAVAFGAAGLGAAQGLTTAVVYGVLAMVAGLPGVLVLFRAASPVETAPVGIAEHVEVLPERLDQPREEVLPLAA